MQQWNACATLNCCMLNSYNSCIIISDIKRMLVWNCNYSLAAPIQSSFLIAIKAFEFIGYYDNLLLCQDKHLAPNFEIISRFIMECTEFGGEWTFAFETMFATNNWWYVEVHLFGISLTKFPLKSLITCVCENLIRIFTWFVSGLI